MGVLHLNQEKLTYATAATIMGWGWGIRQCPGESIPIKR